MSQAYGIRHERRRSQMSYNSGTVMSQTMTGTGKMSQATRDALDAIKVKHVSQAREYETFKQLPKFDHVSLAVIHPTSRQRKRVPVRPTPDMEKEINVSPARLNAKVDTRKEIPESLSRPPITSSMGGGGGRSSSNKNKRPRPISVHFGGT